MINKLIKIISEKLDNDELDEYGDYAIDKLLYGILEINIDSNKYEIYLFDEGEYTLVEECWLMYTQIFEVLRNNEVIGYIGRENKISCCGQENFGEFKEYIPKRIAITTWIEK